MSSFSIASSGATLASPLSACQPVLLNLQTYLAAVHSHPPPAVLIGTMFMYAHINSFVCHSSHFAASAVACSLIGKSVHFQGSSILFVRCRGPIHLVGLRSLLLVCSTTPTPSVVAPALKSSLSGPTITSPSLFLKKWHNPQSRVF